MKNETLYLKIERNSTVKNYDVKLSDVAKMECTNQAVLNKLKTMKILKIDAEKEKRYVMSVLKVIEQIHEEYPDLEVNNLGEIDFLVEYVGDSHPSKIKDVIKIVFVCLITFFGSAFAIMTFNNDVSVSVVFNELYELITGEVSDGFTILEFTYSLGLSAGIIIFYNHIGGRRITKDPTPIEVQMRLYENDVDTTLVETSQREAKTIDVD